MPFAQIGRFTGSYAVDFSSLAPGVVGVLLAFENVDGEKFAVTVNDTCVTTLASTLKSLLSEIDNLRSGAPICPELWDVHPQVVPDPVIEFDAPLYRR